MLEKFDTLFGLKLIYLLCSAADVSKCLQAKDLSLKEALLAVNLASAFYTRQRKDNAFRSVYDGTIKEASNLSIGQPKLPRYKRALARKDDGAHPHHFSSPESTIVKYNIKLVIY